MTPDVYSLVMTHEQRFANALLAVKVNSISSLNVFIVNEKMRGLLDVTNEGFKLFLSFLLHVLKFVYPISEKKLVWIIFIIFLLAKRLLSFVLLL